METFKVILEILVVVGAIFMGVRAGGLGLGMWGGLGTAVLVFVFHLAPGSPPTSAMLIIIAVITAAASMQAAGGIDYLVELALKIIRKNPKQITLVAPLVSYAFTVGSGTSNIFFPLIPVIYHGLSTWQAQMALASPMTPPSRCGASLPPPCAHLRGASSSWGCSS